MRAEGVRSWMNTAKRPRTLWICQSTTNRLITSRDHVLSTHASSTDVVLVMCLSLTPLFVAYSSRSDTVNCGRAGERRTQVRCPSWAYIEGAALPSRVLGL